MSNFDLSPLYRAAIGFDRLANLLEDNQHPSNGDYPPYNVELVDETHYRIIIAVAGFSQQELDITFHDNTLKISGVHSRQSVTPNYLYQGITERDFERQFQLAEHIVVLQAHLDNGLLTVELERTTPKEIKPQRIQIQLKR